MKIKVIILLIIILVLSYCFSMSGMLFSSLFESMDETEEKKYTLKDLSGSYKVTGLNNKLRCEIEKMGKLYSYFSNDLLIYHLVLKLNNYEDYTTEKIIVSFLKGLYSYGYDKDLWEASVIKRDGNKKGIVRGVNGNLTNEELIGFILMVKKNMEKDPKWFDDLPSEFGRKK